MQRFDLVMLPFWDWKKCEALGFRVRDAHLLQQFLKHPSVRRILIVGRPTNLPWMLKTRRWWRPRNGTVCYREGFTALTQVHEKCFSLDVFVPAIITPLKLRWGWWNYSLKLESVINAIRKAQAYLGMSAPVLMVCTPVSTGPVGRLGERLTVFLADDNWLHHPGITRPSDLQDIKAGYDLLFAKSDVVIVNSEAMKRSFAHYRNDIRVIPNGVSIERFIVDNARTPADLARIPRPRVGYAGTMNRRVDVDLIIWLAEQKPHVHFVFLGPILDRGYIRRMFKCPNVHYLGDKHYDLLSNYLINFDVAIIPHSLGQQNDGDSLKALEYLSAGKPVVATNTSDFIRLKGISVSANRNEFLDNLERYLALTDEERRAMARRLRSAIPSERLWRNIANQVVEIIHIALTNKQLEETKE